ncbi:MAG TPA: porin family protein [Puia sp.]|nr:porin family protein [Puia sp.]
MKKSILLGLVLVSSHCFSQSFMQGIVQRLQFGIKGGANYSNYVNAGFNTDGLVGFHAGAIVGFKLTKNLSIQEEFLFSTQGAKVKGDLFGKEDVKVSYITVPFLLKYRTNVGIYFEAGPQVGMRANEDVGNGQMGEFAKKLDLSAAGGIGYQSRSGFGIGARYVAGLSKVGNFQLSNVQTDFRNSVVQASIFYIF